MIIKYEIMYILRPNSKYEQLNNKIEKIICVNSGKIIEKNIWGEKELAYPILKNKKGYYVVIIAKTQSDNINELLRINKITKDILRVLVINTETEKDYVQSTKLSKTKIIEETKKYNNKKFEVNNNYNNKEANYKSYNFNSKQKLENRTENNVKKISSKIVNQNKENVNEKL